MNSVQDMSMGRVGSPVSPMFSDDSRSGDEDTIRRPRGMSPPVVSPAAEERLDSGNVAAGLEAADGRVRGLSPHHAVCTTSMHSLTTTVVCPRDRRRSESPSSPSAADAGTDSIKHLYNNRTAGSDDSNSRDSMVDTNQQNSHSSSSKTDSKNNSNSGHSSPQLHHHPHHPHQQQHNHIEQQQLHRPVVAESQPTRQTAFSVADILDPSKFTGTQAQRQSVWNPWSERRPEKRKLCGLDDGEGRPKV